MRVGNRVRQSSNEDQRNDRTPCVIAPGRPDGNGYGLVWDTDRKKQVKAHRYAWEQAHGPIPPGMCICHHCDVPRCINIDHLFIGTHADNMRDKESKGRGNHRGSPGQSHWNSKLTQTQVTEIRKLWASGEYTQQSLANHYGVSRAHIGHLVNRKRHT
jgi:hypothetical protein